MSEFEDVSSFVTFRYLGGRAVQYDEFLSEIRRLPLDGILGFLGALLVEAVQPGADFFDPRYQGSYLNQAIVDDFPCSLPNVPRVYVPGHVPITGGVHTLVHERNVAWLAHIALLEAKDEQITERISPVFSIRCHRLLLIINDYLSDADRFPVPSTLPERRNVALDWIRYGQFNDFFNPLLMLKLARQHILFKEILPKHFPQIESAFCEATRGIGLQRYFEILILFVTHICHKMKVGRHWISINSLCNDIQAGRDEVEMLLGKWIRTPHEYRTHWEEWNVLRPSTGFRRFYDFVPLRDTPFIEARPGELICPVQYLRQNGDEAGRLSSV